MEGKTSWPSSRSGRERFRGRVFPLPFFYTERTKRGTEAFLRGHLFQLPSRSPSTQHGASSSTRHAPDGCGEECSPFREEKPKEREGGFEDKSVTLPLSRRAVSIALQTFPLEERHAAGVGGGASILVRVSSVFLVSRFSSNRPRKSA